MGIVCLSIVGIILEEMKSGFINVNPTIIRVMRVLRIARGKTSCFRFLCSTLCNIHLSITVMHNVDIILSVLSKF